jgi:hypothetical protein
MTTWVVVLLQKYTHDEASAPSFNLCASNRKNNVTLEGLTLDP